MHERSLKLCNHYAVGPGGVGDRKKKDPVFESGPGVHRGKPVEGLVPLLVGIAVTPVNHLLRGDRLLPYKGEVPGTGVTFYELFPIVSYRPGLYLRPSSYAN